jgi:hypothetical protein
MGNVEPQHHYDCGHDEKAIEKHHIQIDLSINGVEDLDNGQAAYEEKGRATGTQSRDNDVESVIFVPNVDEKEGRTIEEIG